MRMSFTRLLLALLFLSTAIPVNAQHWLYSVRPGDTLWDLCEEYTVVDNCWMTIGGENGVEYPRRIPPGTIIKFPIDWLKQVPEAATFGFVRGDVNYQLAVGSQLLAAQVGINLPIGSKVLVGENSSATVVFANQAILVLESNSELELDMLATGGPAGVVDSYLRLLRGSTTIKVPKKENAIRFEIETPAAVAAVRGTEFRVVTEAGQEADSAAMRTEVLEGTVAVANSVDQQDVLEGFGVIANSNAPVPVPVELLPPPEFNSYVPSQVSNLSLSWDSIDGAESYRADLYSDQEDAELLDSREISTTATVWNELDEGCYRIAVSGIDSLSLQGLPQSANICIVPALVRVNIIENGVAEISTDTLQIHWKAVEGITEYELEVSYDQYFGVIKNTLQTTDGFAMLEIEEKREHYFRVRGISSDGVKGEPGSIGVWSPSQWDRIVAGVATVLVVLALL